MTNWLQKNTVLLATIFVVWINIRIHTSKLEFLENISHEFLYSFRHYPLAPVFFSQPISHFCFEPMHNMMSANRANNFAINFNHHHIILRFLFFHFFLDFSAKLLGMFQLIRKRNLGKIFHHIPIVHVFCEIFRICQSYCP